MGITEGATKLDEGPRMRELRWKVMGLAGRKTYIAQKGPVAWPLRTGTQHMWHWSQGHTRLREGKYAAVNPNSPCYSWLVTGDLLWWNPFIFVRDNFHSLWFLACYFFFFSVLPYVNSFSCVWWTGVISL